jgi:dienelactone hydrolase
MVVAEDMWLHGRDPARERPGILLIHGARAGLDALRVNGNVAGTVAAIGYCLGGLAARTPARSGSAVDAAVSIHGSLATSAPARHRPGPAPARPGPRPW